MATIWHYHPLHPFLLFYLFAISLAQTTDSHNTIIHKPTNHTKTTITKWTHKSMISYRLQNCNCTITTSCLPVQKKHQREVFGFGNENNHQILPLNYSLITTIAWWNDLGGVQEICKAHLHDTRVITGDAPVDENGIYHPITLELLGDMVDDSSLRTEWVEIAVNYIITNFYDGLTFDFESPLSRSDPRNDAYVQLVHETTVALKTIHDGFQISVCAAWGPGLPLGIDGRAYNYKALADVSDYLYVMQYDTRSQIYYECVAAANCPLSIGKLGIEQYLALGIDSEKLIMGVPWYGYTYACVDEKGERLLECNEENNYIETCHLKLVPFRGVDCSDAAGSEIQYQDIRQIINGEMDGAVMTTNIRVGYYQKTKHFNYCYTPNPNSVDSGNDGEVAKDSYPHVRQLWYDDPDTLLAKSLYAREKNLGGVGPFMFRYVDPGTDWGDAFFDTLRVFKEDDSYFQALKRSEQLSIAYDES